MYHQCLSRANSERHVDSQLFKTDAWLLLITLPIARRGPVVEEIESKNFLVLSLYSPSCTRNPTDLISSFFLYLSFFSSLLLQYPIQSLGIPKIVAHYEKYSNHWPSHRGSTGQHLALFSSVMAIEISFRFSFHLSLKGFCYFLCFDFCFSPISLLFPICDLPAKNYEKLYTIYYVREWKK